MYKLKKIDIDEILNPIPEHCNQSIKRFYNKIKMQKFEKIGKNI